MKVIKPARSRRTQNLARLKLTDLSNRQHPLKEETEPRRTAFDESFAIDVSRRRMSEQLQGTHSIDEPWEVRPPEPTMPVLLKDLHRVENSHLIELYVVLESIRLGIESIAKMNGVHTHLVDMTK
jgi:hypothetical protein